MYSTIRRFIITVLIILIITKISFSQISKDKCENSYVDILYGIVYQPQSYNAVNYPYFINDFLKTKLFFDDKCIDDALMKYDLYNQVLVLYQDYDIKKSRFIKLNSDLIDKFEMIDEKGHLYRFISSKEIPLFNQDIIFYEEVYSNKIKYYIGNTMRLNEYVENNKNRFSAMQYHYLLYNNKLIEFRKRKELYEGLGVDIKEIKRFVRKNKLKIKLDKKDNIIKLIKFSEERVN